MTLHLHPFCYRSGSDPHPLLPAFLQYSLNRTSIFTLFKSFLLPPRVLCLKHGYDRITSLLQPSLAPHCPKKKASLQGIGSLPTSLAWFHQYQATWFPLYNTTPCLCAVSSAGNALLSLSHLMTHFFLQDSVHVSPAVKAFSEFPPSPPLPSQDRSPTSGHT